MSYHISQTRTTNNYTLTGSVSPTTQPQQRERSNSSGKKIIIIKRKHSNPSIINSSSHENPSQTHSQITRTQHEYLQHSQHSTKSRQQPYFKHPSESSTITLNPHNQYEQQTTHPKTTSHIIQQSSSQYTTNQSRSHQYEQQLQQIHQELRFFTQRLDQAQNRNSHLSNSLQEKQHQFQYLFKNVYTFINRLFASQIDRLYQKMSTYLHSEDKILFYNLVQKSSGVNFTHINVRQFENDMLTMLKTLNLTLLDRNHLQDVVNSQKLTLQQNMKELTKMQHQNRSLSHEYRVLQKDLNEKSKIRYITREIQTITLKTQQKPLDESKKTADRSREDIIKSKQYKNAQIQTQEKRIGSAESVHKYKPLRYQGIPYRSSPYKNYIRDRSVSNSSKTGESLGSTIRNELKNNGAIKTTPTVQKGYTTAQQANRKPQQKKKLPATSSYLNHLIQSEHHIKIQPQAPDLTSSTRNNRFQQHIDNTKSQLSLRRPPLRNRSQSQQQAPSSRQRSSSKHSITNTSSRVVSTYSLNPVNQYGQKRLCNEMNVKRVRKIEQLSQESDSLSERMRELMEEEELLKQKYRELEQVKVSRDSNKKRSRDSNNKRSRENDNKKSRLNKSKQKK